MPTFALLIRQYTIICNLYIVFQVSLFCNVHFASGRLVFGSGLARVYVMNDKVTNFFSHTQYPHANFYAEFTFYVIFYADFTFYVIFYTSVHYKLCHCVAIH